MKHIFHRTTWTFREKMRCLFSRFRVLSVNWYEIVYILYFTLTNWYCVNTWSVSIAIAIVTTNASVSSSPNVNGTFSISSLWKVEFIRKWYLRTERGKLLSFPLVSKELCKGKQSNLGKCDGFLGKQFLKTKFFTE